MVSDLITEKSFHIRNWLWKQRLERSQSSYAGLIGDASQLRFIFGISGSGVDYLARVIAQPGSVLRFYQNFLARFEPGLILANGADRLALPYVKSLADDHPLFRAYRMLVEYDNEWAFSRMSYCAADADIETLPCLIKEDRCLLGTEAILRGLGCRAMLYVSDPVKIVDRLFSEKGFEINYLQAESQSLFTPYFCARFLRRDYADVMHAHRHIERLGNLREQRILRLTLSCALIQHMFRLLAARYPQQAILVEHERLERTPTLIASLLERLFGDEGLMLAKAVMVNATFQPQGQEKSIWKNAWPERVASQNFLSEAERRLCYRILQDSGLTSANLPAAKSVTSVARSA